MVAAQRLHAALQLRHLQDGTGICYAGGSGPGWPRAQPGQVAHAQTNGVTMMLGVRGRGGYQCDYCQLSAIGEQKSKARVEDIDCGEPQV